MEEIREILSTGLNEVVKLNPENYFRSADKIFDNLETAFEGHQSKIKELRAKKWKFAGSEVGSWLVAGSIDIASVVLGTPLPGLASIVVSQLTDAPKLKDLPTIAKDIQIEDRDLKKSAAGLLFKHRR